MDTEDESLKEARKRVQQLRHAKSSAENSRATEEILKGLSDDLKRAEANLSKIVAEHRVAPGSAASLDVSSALTEKLERYRNLAALYGDLTIEGKSKGTRRRLSPAATNLINLTTQVYPDGQFSGDSEQNNSTKVRTFYELFREVRESGQRLAVVGDPGSGKSNTLRRLLFEYAGLALKDRTSPVPILVDLASIGEVNSFEDARQKASREQYDVLIPAKNSIALVDGLNETSQASVRAILRWLADHPTAPFVVACRKVDYVDRTLPLRRVDILPLDVGQIWEIIGNYFPESEDQSDLFWGLAGGQAKSLWRWFFNNDPLPTFENFWYGDVGRVYSYEVQKSALAGLQKAAQEGSELSGVLEVVRNPFLLSLAVITFASEEELPDSRSELLRAFVEHMVFRTNWSGTGHEDYRYHDRQLPEGQPLDNLLTDLAFSMTERGFGTSSSLEQAAASVGVGSGLNEAELADLLNRTGLVEIQPGSHRRYRFKHQLFQEYLASRRLIEAQRSDLCASELWNPETWWETTPWDEVALLGAESLDDSSDFVAWLAKANPSLAYRCATAPGVFVSQSTFELLYQPETPNVCPLARAAWGRELAKHGDRRPGVGVEPNGLPDISWVRVPEGIYTIGGGGEALKELGLFVAEQQVSITDHFFIARYPVTCDQFEPFLQHGYNEKKFWTPEGWEWKGDQKAPSMWNDQRYRISNHPVVGVSWFEAYAFTRWLSSIEPQCAEGWWEISLPTEAEWESAARYPNGRVFPWGNDFQPGIVNIDETSEDLPVGPFFLNRTSAVGLFEASRSELGIMDMCGNVWEWCLSKWDTEYRFPEDTDPLGTSHRAVRGNSWYNSHQFSPCSAHDCEDPGFGMKDVGIRLVMRKTSSTPCANGAED